MKVLRAPLTLALGVTALFLLYLFSNRHYPWYFLWDMDFVTALDVLLMRSGALPTHIHHTEFGLFLLYEYLSGAAKFFGLISVAALHELDSSLNPFPAVAEYMSLLRFTLPFLVLSLVLALWAVLLLLFQPRRLSALAGLAILLILGLQDSMIINSSAIRSELGSVLCWALALLCFSLYFSLPPKPWRVLFLPLAGVMLGLCFLTKLQSAIFIVMALVFAFFLSAYHDADAQEKDSNRKYRLGLFLLALLSLIFYSYLFHAAWGFYVPCDNSVVDLEYHFGGYGEPTYTRTGGAGFPALLALIALSLANLVLFIWPKRFVFLHGYLTLISLVAGGFMAAFLLHFLCYDSLQTGYAYLLTDFKMLFFRGRAQFLPASLSPTMMHNRDHLVGLLWHEAPLFGVHALLMTLLIGGRALGFIRISKWAIGHLITLSFLATLNTVGMLRFDDKDLIWVEVAFSFLSLLLVMVLWRRAEGFQTPLRMVCLILLAGMLAGNLAHLQTRHRRLDASWNIFGWKDSWMCQGIFGGHQPFQALLDERYPTESMKGVALRTARSHAFHRRAIGFLFQNQRLSLLDTGVISPGFPVWRDDLAYQITSFSPALKEALVVDHSQAPVEAQWLYDKEKTRRVASYPTKIRQGEEPLPLAVLVRADIESLFFVEEGDLEVLLQEVNDYRRPVAALTDYRISLSNGADQRSFRGLHIFNYAEIPLHQIKGRYFSVLKSYIAP